MFCGKCGNPLKEGQAFCAKCGTPVVQKEPVQPEDGPTVSVAKPEPPAYHSPETSPKPEKPVKEKKGLGKGKKALIAAIAALLVLAALGVTVLSVINNGPAHEAIKLFDSGKYEQAVKKYNRSVEGSKLQSSIFSGQLEKQYEKKLNEFADGKMEAADAMAYISAVMDLGVLDNAAEKLGEVIASKADSIAADCASGQKEPGSGMEELIPLMNCEKQYLETSHAADKFRELIASGADAIMEAYLAGTSDYAQSKSELVELIRSEQVNGAGTYANEKLAELEALQQSASAFDNAERLYAEGKLENALKEYALVDKSSPYYEQAQEKYNAVLDEYKNKMLEAAQTKKNAGDYPGAIALLSNSLTVLGEDTQIDGLIEQYTKEYHGKIKSDALSRSTELRSEKKYVEAIGVIDRAMETIGEDTDLVTLKKVCIDEYVKDVTDQVEAVLESNWNEAKLISDNAVAEMPGNSELAELLQRVENAKPVNIEQIYAITNNYFKINERFEDTYQNKYTRTLCCWSGYIIFNLAGEYKTLEFTLAPEKSFSSYYKSTIRIYNDDELIYSAELTRYDHAIPVSLNVTGTDLLKIEVNGGECVMLADAILKK